MPAMFCYGLCHMSIQEFTECYLTHKKAGLCAVMSYVAGAHKGTCVVHWNMPNHRSSIYYEQVEVRSAALKGQTKRGMALHERPTSMLPRELIWEGVAAPHETE